ncbi:DNA-processing protein DprA [Geotalea toluenoxydans]|uniref:DNA-processing protein DprA n=1 Tax=Geotalea toluenoxydans TaxID=421624 RepID=UPI0006D1FD68|nr:DNA-processing protein DprA [Geotalea toluenoxydans]
MDHYYWFALKSVPGVGNVTFRKLLEAFETPERVLKASVRELARVKGISPNLAASIVTHEYRRIADLECEAVARQGVIVVDFLAAEYPKILLQINDPPPYLYVKGELCGSETSVAIVGSRRASTYGLMTTERLAGELALNNVTVVSGMARGVDTAAHRGALKAEGRSIGVLGCGIDIVYPPENRPLFKEMAEKGALVSEFPMGTTPLAENFPRRNRIISGMSQGVLVVEAVQNSGSLITARYALEQGREIFAIPGNINSSNSRGTNLLIKQGAKLVEEVGDILEELHLPTATTGQAPAPAFSLTPQEAGIFTLLAESPLHIDDIIVRSELTVPDLSAILLRLELKGAVVQLPGKHFCITK